IVRQEGKRIRHTIVSLSLRDCHGALPAGMTSLGKRIVAGALIAAGGAFVWAFADFMAQNWRGGDRLFEVLALAAYAVLLTSWFVLPMGGILGVIMPRVVRGCSTRTAFFRGA